MSRLDHIRIRYMRDPLSVRLGGIASNLARIRTCAARGIGAAAVGDMLRESAYMIEWTARDAEVEVTGQLVELQVQLALWALRWPSMAGDAAQQTQVGREAGRWSDRLLEISGLLA